MSADDLHARLAALPAGASFVLEPPGKEFQGPLRLQKPVIVRGQGCTVWAERGPVIVIESPGVTLVDLNIEVTGSAPVGTAGDSVCALRAAAEPTLERVTVRGHVEGVKGEVGTWAHPTIVRFGKIQAATAHTFTLPLTAPVPCKLESSIAGVTVSPATLTPGTHVVTLSIEALADGIRLRGALLIRTANLTRRIELSAHVAAQGLVGRGQTVPGVAASAAPVSAPAGAVPVAKLVEKPVPAAPVAAPKPVPPATMPKPPLPVAKPLPSKPAAPYRAPSTPVGGAFSTPIAPASKPVAEEPSKPVSDPIEDPSKPASDPTKPKPPGYRKIVPPPTGGLFG